MRKLVLLTLAFLLAACGAAEAAPEPALGEPVALRDAEVFTITMVEADLEHFTVPEAQQFANAYCNMLRGGWTEQEADRFVLDDAAQHDATEDMAAEAFYVVVQELRPSVLDSSIGLPDRRCNRGLLAHSSSGPVPRRRHRRSSD